MSFPFQECHGWMDGQIFRLKADTTNPHSPKLKGGILVRVVMVSRFGDCGITADLTKDRGYTNRVFPWELEEVSGTAYNRVVAVPENLRDLYGSEAALQLSISDLEMASK